MNPVIRSLPVLLILLALLPVRSLGQDVVMAKGNAQFTISLNPANLHGKAMRKGLTDAARNYSQFDYSVKVSRPISFTAEYAVSNYTTVGVNFNYYRYDLSERRADALGIQNAATKGSHLDVHVRALRYVIANSRGALYVLGEIGVQTRSIEYFGGLRSIAHINTFPETRRSDYNPLSYDFGLGLKGRVYKQFGAGVEFTMLAPYGRYGLFYILRPAGRRSNDQIGW